MKYLEFPRLTVLTTFLDSKPLGDIVLRGRVEAFSCKSAGKDKKLAKLLQRRYTQELKGIPAEQLEGVMSPLGPMSSASTRKLLINLIATMNASFPDFDFSSLSADEFRVEEMKMAVNIINTRLAAPIEVDDPGFTDELWSSLNKTITLKDSVVYSYVADLDSDPLSCGSLWSINYFFYNQKLARIVYFTCVAAARDRVDGAGRMASPGAIPDRLHTHSAPSPAPSPLAKKRRTGEEGGTQDDDAATVATDDDLGAYRSAGVAWERSTSTDNEFRIGR